MRSNRDGAQKNDQAQSALCSKSAVAKSSRGGFHREAPSCVFLAPIFWFLERMMTDKPPIDEEHASSHGRLMLREWQLWHTYTSAFSDPLPPLNDVARNLVVWGIADCALASDSGVAFWHKPPDSSVVTGARPVDRDRARLERADKRLSIASGTVLLRPSYNNQVAELRMPLEATPFAIESFGSWAQTRLSELRLFGQSRLPPPYVWAALGACSFIANDPDRRRLLVYPLLKIFETGVVIVEFRMLSPDYPVHVTEYIDHYVNAALGQFRWVTVPPGLAAWAPLATAESAGFGLHIRRAFEHWQHQRETARRVDIEKIGDFVFEQAVLGEARDEQRLHQALTDAEPEIERIAREATRSAAAAQGLRLTADYKIGSIEPSVPHGPQVDAADTSLEDSGPRSAAEITIDRVRLEHDAERIAVSNARAIIRKIAGKAYEDSTSDCESFSGLALVIMKAAAYVAGGSHRGPRRGMQLALRGPGRRNAMINHWVGRPHTHLFRFNDQSASAAHNAKRYSDDFAAILARIPPPLPSNEELKLPASSRLFDDHGAYIQASGTLWVDAHSHEETSPEYRQQNRAMRVHDNQSKVELLEYGYALHRRIADRALALAPERDATLEELLHAQRELAEFEWAVQDTGSYGEIRGLLERGWAQYGLPQIRKRITDALLVRQALATHRRSAVTARWMALIAIVAGLVAVPPLVDIIFKPLWNVAGLPKPESKDVFALVLSLAALATVGTCLVGGYLWARAHREKRPRN